jgi:hypothetical protein
MKSWQLAKGQLSDTPTPQKNINMFSLSAYLQGNVLFFMPPVVFCAFKI